MQKLLEYSFESPIWRLVPSFEGHSWIIELRTPNQKVSYFYCTLRNKPTLLDLELDWWSGIEAVLGKHIVFHGFAQQDLPFHQGIKVVDAEKKEVIWAEDFLIFESATDKVLWAKTPSANGHIIPLDLLTGKELEVDQPKETNEPNEVPHHYHQENEHFPSISQFIHSLTGKKPVRTVEYLETHRGIIMSYFIPNAKLFDNYLLVTDSNGKVLLHQLLAPQLKGIVLGTFYVSKGLLSFVQDRNKFVVYSLS